MVDLRSTKSKKDVVEEFTHVKNLLAEKEAALSAKEAAYQELQQKYNELLDAAKRMAADFDNFRKRTEGEKEKMKGEATKNMIQKLLPMLDQFSLCLQHSAHHDEFVKAMELMHSQFLSFLEGEGVLPIHALDEQFDPRLHEAVMYVPSEKEENCIVEEIQKGYVINDMLLRASKVKIAKNMQETKQTLEG